MRESTGGPNQTTEHPATYFDCTLQTRNNTQQLVSPTGGIRRLYSEKLKNKDNNKRHTMSLKPKDTTSTPEQIKSQLKKQYNPN